MANFPDFGEALDPHVDVFRQTVDDCLELYRSSAEAWIQSRPPNGTTRTSEATLSLMEDLGRGLLIKIFLTILQADRHFSAQERELAQVLLLKLWGRTFFSDEIGTVVQELIPDGRQVRLVCAGASIRGSAGAARADERDWKRSSCVLAI